ncbi:MAG: ATP-binding protein [Thermoplasmataceae archaeon]
MKINDIRVRARITKIKKFKKYYLKDSYKTFVKLVDSTPGNNIDISAYINNLNFPSDVIFGLKQVKKDTKFLGRLRADKRSNTLIEKKKYGRTPSTRTIFEEVYSNELYEMKGDESVSMYNVNLMLRQHSGNPIKLKEYYIRVKTAMETMGIIINKGERISKKMIKNLAELKFPAAERYLIDNRKLINVIPWFTEPEADSSGVLIGLDSYTNKPIFLNVWDNASHNCIVLGEIGSGKSYFSKAFILRSLLTDLVDEIYIFDPMNEYFTHQKDLQGINVEIVTVGLNSSPQIELKISNSVSAKKIVIYRFYENSKIESNFLFTIESTFNAIKNSTNIRKIVILDEAHLLLQSEKNSKIYSELIRSSRHYKTSVFSISQGLNEFIKSPYGNSIIENSISMFIFRNRFWDSLKFIGVDPLDYGLSDFKNLTGGKGDTVSEFIYYSGGRMRKMIFISTQYEISSMK